MNDTTTPCVQDCLDGQITFHTYLGQVECLNQIPDNTDFYVLLDIYNLGDKPQFSFKTGLPLVNQYNTFVPNYNSSLNPYCAESEVPLNCVTEWTDIFPYGT